MYCKREDDCIYSKSSSHAAGHQNTDKLDVKCGWQICNWHCLSNQSIQPFLVLPTHPPYIQPSQEICPVLLVFAQPQAFHGLVSQGTAFLLHGS